MTLDTFLSDHAPSNPFVEKLPEPDHTRTLQTLLAVLNTHPDLTHFRLLVRDPSDRQLALFAALERATLHGDPLAFPPPPDDHADALLCDILDALDRDPTTSDFGSAYGSDRHLVNLQALGVWTSDQPNNRPTALELFTTRFADLTTNPLHDLQPENLINSPLLQDSPPGGELIAQLNAIANPPSHPTDSPQLLDLLLITGGAQTLHSTPDATSTTGIIHHEASHPGEKSDAEIFASAASALSTTSQSPQTTTQPAFSDLEPSDVDPSSDPAELIPSRPVRRGRPLLLDERAKGRILGLMAYGLSLRQAASQLGLHHTTLVAAMKRDEEFADQVSESRLDAIAQPLITVVQASRRSWRAAAWLAKFLEDRNKKTAPSAPQP